MLNSFNAAEVSTVLLKSFINSLGHEGSDFGKNLLSKLSRRLHKDNKMKSLVKYKNYCLLSGRARTYSRSLHVARHNMRKLVGLGLISGLIK